MQVSALKNNTFRLSLFVLLLTLIFSAGCNEEGYGPPQTQKPDTPETDAPAEPATPAKPSEPVLMVGSVTMPMPAPDGFKRIPGDHPLMRSAQNRLASGEVLLCLFERGGDTHAGQPGGGMSLESLLRRELLQVSTLGKWLNADVSSLDFLKIKQPWQDESIEFNQTTLSNFEEAVQGRLAAEREFNYNLGMIDSSPLHISFLRVEKHTAPAGEAVYTCATTSLLWRHGKILRIGYSKPVENFGQIHGVVAESVGYVQKLQAIDRSTRVSGASATGRFVAQNYAPEEARERS